MRTAKAQFCWEKWCVGENRTHDLSLTKGFGLAGSLIGARRLGVSRFVFCRVYNMDPAM
jgi:hypothetical protein